MITKPACNTELQVAEKLSEVSVNADAAAAGRAACQAAVQIYLAASLVSHQIQGHQELTKDLDVFYLCLHQDQWPPS